MVQNPPGQLNTDSYPRLPEFCQDNFFNLIEKCIPNHIKKSVTNFRKPLEVGLKLAIMLRHLATGETYTSLQYHWLAGRTTICKFLPRSAKPSLMNSRKNICTAPLIQRIGKGWRGSSERPPISWGTIWEAYHHEEDKEIWK